MESFNTREISIGLWLILLAVWGLSRVEVRIAAAGLLRAAIKPTLLVPVVASAGLTVAVAGVLHRVALWTLAELKDTIIWFLFTGITLLFRGVNARDPNRAIRSIIWDAAMVTVFLEFLLNTYTFPLFVELLLFPFMAVIAMMSVIADSETRFAQVAAALKGVQTIAGFSVLAFTLGSFVHNAGKLWAVESGRRFFLPIVLSIAFIPCAYFIALLSAYEQLFVPFKVYKKPFLLRSYAKLKLWIALKFRLRKICVAQRRIGFKLAQISNREDVDVIVSHLCASIPAPPPVTADKPSYLAGYRAGYGSSALQGEERDMMHRRCDAEIAERHYYEESFNEGFVAGAQDADLQGERDTRINRA